MMNKPTSRSRATGRVTLADVARLAGVSPITVSRALRGERAVDPELVARVRPQPGNSATCPIRNSGLKLTLGNVLASFLSKE